MICKRCGWWDRICHCGVYGSFNTTKDRLYNFTDTITFGKPIEVEGKSHWKKLLKRRGLTDDFEQKPKSKEELKNQKQNYKKLDKGWVKDQILKELHDKGLYNKVWKRR